MNITTILVHTQISKESNLLEFPAEYRKLQIVAYHQRICTEVVLYLKKYQRCHNYIHLAEEPLCKQAYADNVPISLKSYQNLYMICYDNH